MSKRKLRVGDVVIMIECYESKKYGSRKWTVMSDPWDLCGNDVVLLDGYSGGFSVDCLALVCPVCQASPVVDYLNGRTCSLLCDAEYYSIDGRFRRFHEKNPSVYEQLVRMARQAKLNGADKLGIAMLFEVIRWNVLSTTGEPFKLSNDFRSRYARLIMEQEPDLAGIFDTRPLTSE